MIYSLRIPEIDAEIRTLLKRLYKLFGGHCHSSDESKPSARKRLSSRLKILDSPTFSETDGKLLKITNHTTNKTDI